MPAFFAPAPPGLWRGAALWLAFGAIALVVRGVRWDEDFEFAQAMIGAVAYPEGHPLPIYTRGAYNLQFYLSALTVWLEPRPLVLCGLRNLFFIWSTVIPPYLLSAAATGRPLWGHCATALFLAGVHLAFDGAYPLFLWPGMFSNGHIGIAYALIVVAFMAMGKARWVFLLLGVMPAIHLGQMAPLLAVTPLFVLALWRRDGFQSIRGALPFLAAGLVFCAIFWIVQQRFVLPLPQTGPYAGQFDAREIWEGRIAFHDMHRQIPYGNSHILVAGALVLACAGMGTAAAGRLPGAAWLWFGGYAAAVVGVVYGIMAVHYSMGMDVPYLLLGWLPYRLVNHLPALLLAMMFAVLFPWAEADRGGERRWPALVAALFAVLASQPLWRHAIPSALYDRYLQDPAWVAFGLWGVAVSVMLCRIGSSGPRVPGLGVALLVVAGICALAFFHQFGVVAVALGLALGAIATRIPAGAFPEARRTRVAIAALLVVCVATTWGTEFRHREHLPIGAFGAEVATLLRERGEEQALLIGPPEQVLLQAQTGHPVLVDMATGFHASYVPSLGPSIQSIYADVYGIHFNPAHAPEGATTWQATWAARSQDEWARLAEVYDAPYLIAPPDVPIDAPQVFANESNVLYRIGR